VRIAFVNTLYPPYGSAGAEVTLRNLVRQMRARGHDCVVVTLTPDRNARVGEIDGAVVHYLPLANVFWPHGGARPGWLKPIFQALDAFNPVMQWRLRQVLRATRPDVVNCHNLQGFSASAWVAAKQLGIPCVQTIHDYYTACPRSAMWRPGRGNCAQLCGECRVFGAPRRRLSALPDAVTCVSHRVFDRLTAAGAFAHARVRARVRIIRGMNPCENLPPMPPRLAGPLRLGFMGRLDPSKGVTNLLDAFGRLPPGAATLRIAGSGGSEFVAQLAAQAAGLAGVEMLGHVAPEAFFPTIDLLVIPSVWEDPFPRVFHEALAYGVPSMTTPLGGLPEVIFGARTGFVSQGSDAASLHTSLAALLATPWDRALLQESCRQAAASYAPEVITNQYEAVFSAAYAGSRLPENCGEDWVPAAPVGAA
jgi:glycosyltransferase involved in cell wall biosynthesis